MGEASMMSNMPITKISTVTPTIRSMERRNTALAESAFLGDDAGCVLVVINICQFCMLDL
jgi:hypothetical protein